jgi:HEAT repeat protein
VLFRSPLKTALEDSSDGFVAQTAGEALAEIGQLAVPVLTEALGAAQADGRRAAAKALGKVRDRRAVAPLVSALGDKEWSVRLWAAWALGRIGDSSAIEPLRTMANDENERVRSAAAGALKKIKGEEAGK